MSLNSDGERGGRRVETTRELVDRCTTEEEHAFAMMKVEQFLHSSAPKSTDGLKAEVLAMIDQTDFLELPLFESDTHVARWRSVNALLHKHPSW